MITLILVANGTEARLLSATQRVNPRDLQEVAHLMRAMYVPVARLTPSFNDATSPSFFS